MNAFHLFNYSIGMWAKLFVTLVILLAMDFAWLTLNKNGYSLMVSKVQGSPLKVQLLGAIMSYICVFLAITFFVLPGVENDTGNKFWLSLKYGGFLGLLIYGVFNFTNLAIFSNYDIKMALRDTLWGVTLFTITSWIIVTIFTTKPKFVVEFTPKA